MLEAIYSSKIRNGILVEKTQAPTMIKKKVAKTTGKTEAESSSGNRVLLCNLTFFILMIVICN